MGGIGWPEILIIAVVILVLFGSRKMPDAARSLGRSMRILKTEVKGLHDEDDDKPAATAPPAELPAGQSPAAAPPVTSQVPTTEAPAQPSSAAGERPDAR